jgi:hypothetical protein
MNHEARFLTKLLVTPWSDGNQWVVCDELKFLDMNGNVHVVHSGFVTDFASIPSLARLGATVMLLATALLPWAGWSALALLALGFVIAWLDPVLNGDELLDAPAVLHDEGYRRKRLGNTSWLLKFYWDWILFQAMRANGCPLWKCWLIWFNVAAFGWFAWFIDGRQSAGKGGNQ